MSITPGVSAARPAHRLLLSCAVRGPRAVDAPLASGDLDWIELLRLADDHGLLAQLAGIVEKGEIPGVPEEARDRLREYARTTAIHNHVLAKELVEVVRLLTAAGVPVVPFKGPTIAAALYGDVGARPFNDLDLLIPDRARREAHRILEQSGYVPEDGPLSPRREAALVFAHAQGVYVSADAMVALDVHWRLFPPGFPARLDGLGFMDRLSSVRLPAGDVPVFAAADLLLILAAHGAKHKWQKLVLLSDVDRLVDSIGPDEWPDLIDRARRGHCRKMLLLALELARRLLGTNLPESIVRQIAAEAALDAIAASLTRALFEPPPAPSGLWRVLDVHPMHLRICDTTADRLTHFGCALVLPTEEDWTRLPLPDRLFPLYYLERPLRKAAFLARSPFTSSSAGRRGRKASTRS